LQEVTERFRKEQGVYLKREFELSRKTRLSSDLPGLIALNLVGALSARLQEVTERFRKEQGVYLKREFELSCKTRLSNGLPGLIAMNLHGRGAVGQVAEGHG
jgi:hypothetical protein